MSLDKSFWYGLWGASLLNRQEEKIYKAVVYPIRRRVIEHLYEKQYASFSELLRCTSIKDHGKLGFHLRALSGLIKSDFTTKKYSLTAIGQLAAELIWDTRFLIARSERDIVHLPSRYVRRLGPGAHAVFFYDTEEDKREVCFSFLLAGLLRNEAVVYLVPKSKMNLEATELIRYGINANYVSKGAFTIMSAEDWYLNKGKAQADKIIANWQALLKQKKKAGFTRLRVVGESSAFYGSARTRELMEYEKKLGRRLDESFCILCLYDRKGLQEDDLRSIENLHGHSIYKRTAYCTE
jgi:hypothetical protein